MGKGKKKDDIICLCNCVPRSEIEKAMREGIKDLNELADKTTAGIGPCGGSCRRITGPMLEHFKKTGTFPDTVKKDNRGKKGKNKSKDNKNGSDHAAS